MTKVTIVLALALFVVFGVQTRSAQAAPNSISVAQAEKCETDGTVKTWIEWNTSGVAAQWVDVSLVNNGFVDGSYVGNGPVPANAVSIIRYLVPGRTYFVRVTSPRANVWDVSGTFTFTTHGCGTTTSVVPAAPALGPCNLQADRLRTENVRSALAYQGNWRNVNGAIGNPSTFVIRSMSATRIEVLYLFGPTTRQEQTYVLQSDGSFAFLTGPGGFFLRMLPNGSIDGSIVVNGSVTSTINATRCAP